MKLYTLENGRLLTNDVENIDYAKQCDILCVGAGCAGIYAASAAAEECADVLLIENDDNIGGMHVCGNVHGYYYGFSGGSFEDDDKKCHDDTVFFKGGISPEPKQIHMTERLHNAGVALYCGYTPTGLYFENDCAVGARVFDGSKEINISFRLLIDATSDGYLIRMCPIDKHYGRHSDSKTVPFTVRTQYYCNGAYRSQNTDSGFVNQYDAQEFSNKIVCAHANTASLLPNVEFLSVASHTGVREGLTFEGEETLRYEDILYGKAPEKVLFYAYSDLDKHGHDLAADDELFQNWWVVSNLSTVTVRIPVPLGCVVPRGLGGIVTAGRCFCTDSYAQSAVRMNRDMFRMGECVGVAAAMAVKEKVPFCGIDYSSYVEKVTRRGCYAGDVSKQYGFDYPGGNKPYVPVEFDIKKTLSLLETESPGVAVWSCFISKSPCETASLVNEKMLSETDMSSRANCAIALGIMGDVRALSVLREVIANRDCYYFKDCRRSNQFRTAVAVCLLGRIGEKKDASLIEQIIFDDAEFERPMYHTLKPDYLYYARDDRNFVYFNCFTHACAALVKLYKRHGLDLAALHTRFETLFADNKVIRRITDGEPDEPAYLETADFERYILAETTVERQV